MFLLLKLLLLPIWLPLKIIAELLEHSGHQKRPRGRKPTANSSSGAQGCGCLLVIVAAVAGIAALGGAFSGSTPHVGADSHRSHTPSPTPAASPRHHRRVAALRCSATVSAPHPADYTTEYVQVTTAPYAAVTTVAQYRTTSTEHTARADANGHASIAYYISGATPGYQVQVSVKTSMRHRTGTCAASFTPTG